MFVYTFIMYMCTFKVLPLNHREAKTDIVFKICSIYLNYASVLGVYVGVYMYVQVPVEARRECQVPRSWVYRQFGAAT